MYQSILHGLHDTLVGREGNCMFHGGEQLKMKRKVVLCLVITFLMLSVSMLVGISQAGTTWSFQVADSPGLVGQYCSFAFDPYGNPHISYYDISNMDLKYARWTGSAWSVQPVDSTGQVGYWTSIAFDNPLGTYRNPCISYYDVTNADLKYASWTGSAWSVQPVDSIGDVGRFSSLAFNLAGAPCISYFDFTNGDLKYATKSGSTWVPTTVDSTGYVGEYSSLVLDSSGNPRISYYDSTNGDLKYARWTGSAWSVQPVDSIGDVGQYSSLVLDSSGNPRISYYDSTNGDLKYAAWSTQILPPGWLINTVDYTGDVGQYTSIALDSSGHSHISYYDKTNGDLKYLGSSWFTYAVDSTGDVGMSSSLAFDSSGDPHICYLDRTNYDLKYASGQSASPIGSIKINGGDNYTASTSVTLTLTYSASGSNISQVHYSNDGTWDTEPWESPTASKTWTLASGDGTKIVYYQIRDLDGAVSSTYSDSIVLDTSAPTGSISINGGAAYTSSTSVTLALAYSDATTSVTIAQYSNDGTNWLDWAGPVTTKAWNLTSGDGTKTVYYHLYDAAGNTAIFTDTIVLDTVAPTGSIRINDGAATTSSASVTLSLTYSDAASGVSAVRYSNDGVWDSELWETPTDTKAWILTSGDGEKTVYCQIKDSGGMLSSTYLSKINLVTEKVVTPTFNPAGGSYSSAQSVTISCTTPGSSIRYTTDGADPTSTTGTVYSGAVSVGSSQTLKARAFASGITDSDVASATYTINIPSKVVTPAFSPTGGSYSSAQSVTISCTTPSSAIRYTTDGADPTSTTGTVFSGTISVSSSQTLKARAFASGMTDSDVASATYTITPPPPPPPPPQPKVTTPTLGPAGGTYTSAQSITISCSTSGSSIRYTTDGAIPTSSTGTAYSGAISVASNQTLKAKAFANGMTDSDVASATYTIVDKTPPSGTIQANNGATKTDSNAVTLNLAATDNSGTVTQMRFSNDNSTYSQWQAYSSTATWTLTEGNGAKTVYAQFKDEAGNIATTSVGLTVELPSGTFPTDLAIIAVGVVVAAVVVALVVYKLLKRPKKPAAPAQLRVTAEPANLVANGEEKSVITIQLLDKNGKLMSALSDTTIRVTAGKGKIEPSVVTIPKGKDTEKTVLVSSTETGPVPVSANSEGLKNITITLNFVEKQRFCMHCGTRMSLQAKACQNCGKTPLAGVDTKACPNCEATIPFAAKFCSECGTGQKT
jgi:ribosomal protein L40E